MVHKSDYSQQDVKVPNVKCYKYQDKNSKKCCNIVISIKLSKDLLKLGLRKD